MLKNRVIKVANWQKNAIFLINAQSINPTNPGPADIGLSVAILYFGRFI
jgi:hypothetical protein